eukprot:15430995-Alexandrium_andersonii.AAC.1
MPRCVAPPARPLGGFVHPSKALGSDAEAVPGGRAVQASSACSHFALPDVASTRNSNKHEGA